MLKLISALLLLALFSIVSDAVGAVALDLLSKEERAFLEGPGKDLRPVMDAATFPPEDIVRSGIKDALVGHARKSFSCNDVSILDIETPYSVMLDPYISKLYASGQIKSAWYVRSKVKVCKNQFKWRFLVAELPNGQYQTIVQFFGATLAWGTLAQDTMKGVFGVSATYFKKEAPNCAVKKGFRLLDTTVSDASNIGPQLFGVRYRGEWSEQWVVHSCGKLLYMTVKFKADGNGGAYYVIDDKSLFSK